MQYMNGAIGVLLVVMTILQFDDPARGTLVPIYAVGAMVALVAVKRGLPLWSVRVLAVITTGAMFFYFAGFFEMAPHLQADWYRREAALEAWGLLFAAFAMIPVLSEYSC